MTTRLVVVVLLLTFALVGMGLVTLSPLADQNGLETAVGAAKQAVVTTIKPSATIAPEQTVTQTASVSSTGRSHVRLGGKTLAYRDQSGIKYVHDDLVGSATAATNTQGAVVSHNQYLAFGKMAASDEAAYSTPRKYANMELDATDLYYVGARTYMPNIGRFAQSDPILRTASSQYMYAANRPLTAFDPDGRDHRESYDECGCNLEAHYNADGTRYKIPEWPAKGASFMDRLKREAKNLPETALKGAEIYNNAPKNREEIGNIDGKNIYGIRARAYYSLTEGNSDPPTVPTLTVQGRMVPSTKGEDYAFTLDRWIGSNNYFIGMQGMSRTHPHLDLEGGLASLVTTEFTKYGAGVILERFDFMLYYLEGDSSENKDAVSPRRLDFSRYGFSMGFQGNKFGVSGSLYEEDLDYEGPGRTFLYGALDGWAGNIGLTYKFDP